MNLKKKIMIIKILVLMFLSGSDLVISKKNEQILEIAIYTNINNAFL